MTGQEYTLGGRLRADQSDQEVREVLANLSYSPTSWTGPHGDLENVRTAVANGAVLPGRTSEQSLELVEHVIAWTRFVDKARARRFSTAVLKTGGVVLVGLGLLAVVLWSFSSLPPSLIP